MPRKKNVIVIVPCYNEQEALPHFINALEQTRSKIIKKYQIDILLINDGSKDGTQLIIEELATKFPYIYYRSFSENAGHQSAVRAGVNAAQGYDAAIMMDADIQHPPELIPKMLDAWDAGAKIVQMVRHDTSKDVGLFKYLTSHGYYFVINRISDLGLEYGASDFRLIDQSVINSVVHSPEGNLFLRGYFSWLPVTHTVIEYTPNKRVAGSSKYTLKKMLDLAYHGVLQFSEKPLRLATTIGSILALLSFLYGIYLAIQHFVNNHAVSGWTSLMVTMLFCFGINFILLGFIGVYLAHSLELQKHRPEYIIADEKLPKLQ